MNQHLFKLLFFGQLFISTAMYAQIPTTTDTLKMEYKVSGSGPTLALVPGGLTGWVSWEPFVPKFDANKVVQVQLLNVQYGLEDKLLPNDYSVKTESNALATSLKEVGVASPADFIGWSYGGLILLDFALDHPELIKSLTLIEPPAFWVLRAHNQLSEEAKKTATLLSSFKNDITENDLETFLSFVGFAKPGSSVRDDPKWNGWVKYRYSLRQNSVVPAHEDNIERLRNFKAPALLVKGTGSASFLHDAIDLMAKDLPHAQVIELPAGHAPHIVSMDRFLEKVKEFQTKTSKE